MGRKILRGFVLAFFLSACGGRNMSDGKNALPPGKAAETPAGSAEIERDPAAIVRALEELAELERTGVYTPRLALAESGLRERAGDYAGAAAAAYKELLWDYGRGNIPKENLEQALERLRALKTAVPGEDTTVRAAGGILAFEREEWSAAEGILGVLFDGDEDPDSFSRWMLLVCALEQNREHKKAAGAYRSIRARYAQFPAYWYRGARAFAGAVAAEYAERCVNLAPEGPFAAECRNILAVFTGLKSEDGPALKTKTEIEDIISRSVKEGNPAILSGLNPLISLPDNPYTVYAVGALRALAPVPLYRDYFSGQAAAAGGRLAERFAYICRG
jgi:hypothetical protein